MTKAILYARVSTDEQARSGYSLAHEIEALRAHAAHGGYEVLEEVEDAGFSGASLKRPGLDRVRDLVAGGDVSVVLAQDRDRFAREPAYLFLLREEFALKGCVLRGFGSDGIASPSGGSRWNTRTLANLLESDLYLPRPAGEVAALVDPQAAATLDAEKVYGLWEFGRRETRRCKERDDLTGIFDPGVYLPDVLEDGPDVLTEHPRERYETVVTAGSNPTTVG